MRFGLITQLPVAVMAPGPEAAIGLEGESVIIPGGHGGDVKQENLLRLGTASVRPIAQLPVVIPTPGPEAAFTSDEHAVGVSSGDARLRRAGLVYLGYPVRGHEPRQGSLVHREGQAGGLDRGEGECRWVRIICRLGLRHGRPGAIQTLVTAVGQAIQ